MNNTDSIDEIKQRLAIVDVVSRSGLTVVGQGRIRTTQEHDSLRLWTETNTWYWFSQGVGGDVFDWWMRVRPCDFRQALEELAGLAGVALRPLSPERQAEVDAARAGRRILDRAAAHYHAVLLRHPGAQQARAYCAGRGWTEETSKRERIGYVLTGQETEDGDEDRTASPRKDWQSSGHNDELFSLSGWLQENGLMGHPMARAVLSIPQGHLVYVHQVGGQVVYLSARSIEGKRHWNLPAELAGPRQVYHGHPARLASDALLVVEGQADAISLGQLGVRSVALCGVAAGDAPAALGVAGLGLGAVVALDSDDAGREKGLGLAQTLGPLARVLVWPDSFGKDAAAALVHGLSTGDLLEEIERSLTTVEALAWVVKRSRGDARQEAMQQLLATYRGLEMADPIAAADVKPSLAETLGKGMSQFNRLLKAAEKADKEKASPESYENSLGLYVGGHLFEQCVRRLEDGRMEAFYWVRLPSGELRKQAMVDVGAVTYVPYSPQEEDVIKGRALLLPSDCVESGGERALLSDVRRFIHKWLDVDHYFEQIASYYVLLTWFYDAGFETIPYLRALGDWGSGKTRFIETVGVLCYRPMFMGGGDSEPTIFRLIDMAKGTMIVDESDFDRSDAAALIAKVINLGNRVNGHIKRLDKTPDGRHVIRMFSVFCPKIFAARYGFQDQASDSRCLTKHMTSGNPRPDIPLDTDATFWAEAEELRNRLLHYRLMHWRPIQVDQSLVDRTIMARLAQVTLALRMIIKDPAALKEMDGFVRLYNLALINERQLTQPAVVTEALARIRWPKATLMELAPDWTVKHITEVANGILTDLDPEDLLTPRKASVILSQQLGITGRTREASGRKTVQVDDELLLALMRRYGIEKPAQEAETGDSPNVA